MTATIRRATPADFAAILPHMIAFNEEEHITWRPAPMEAALLRLLGDAAIGFLLVACNGASGPIIGYAISTFGYDIEFAGRDAFLTELFVTTGARGRGVGRALLDTVVRDARANGAGAVHLVVRHENAAARHLYTRAGFDAVPRLLMTKAQS